MDDLYAAMRKPYNARYRGQWVLVCSGDRCTEAKVIDCNCGDGANLIDLYGDAFEKLAPLGTGRLKVRVVLP